MDTQKLLHETIRRKSLNASTRSKGSENQIDPVLKHLAGIRDASDLGQLEEALNQVLLNDEFFRRILIASAGPSDSGQTRIDLSFLENQVDEQSISKIAALLKESAGAIKQVASSRTGADERGSNPPEDITDVLPSSYSRHPDLPPAVVRAFLGSDISIIVLLALGNATDLGLAQQRRLDLVERFAVEMGLWLEFLSSFPEVTVSKEHLPRQDSRANFNGPTRAELFAFFDASPAQS